MGGSYGHITEPSDTGKMGKLLAELLSTSQERVRSTELSITIWEMTANEIIQ
jgi:hypothetical protein